MWSSAFKKQDDVGQHT